VLREVDPTLPRYGTDYRSTQLGLREMHPTLPRDGTDCFATDARDDPTLPRVGTDCFATELRVVGGGRETSRYCLHYTLLR
jgi:hypothetical protein